jgi:hypothetical protein
MTPYRDITGHSGVVGFELGPGAITVEYRGGARYLYDANAPGPTHVSRMQALAAAGQGLATYISKHVRGSYARRLRSGPQPL